jgi:hypothetical protein
LVLSNLASFECNEWPLLPNVEKLELVVRVMKGLGGSGPEKGSVSERESLGLEEHIKLFVENLRLACGSQDKSDMMKRPHVDMQKSPGEVTTIMCSCLVQAC